MKTLTFILGLLALALTVAAQNPQCNGKRYDKKLKDSVQCRSPFVNKETGFCQHHDPARVHCASKNSKGQPCGQTILVDGKFCRLHTSKT